MFKTTILVMAVLPPKRWVPRLMEVFQLRLFCRICRVECGECVSDVTVVFLAAVCCWLMLGKMQGFLNRNVRDCILLMNAERLGVVVLSRDLIFLKQIVSRAHS